MVWHIFKVKSKLVLNNDATTDNHILIKTSGEDVDDEEFTITILFNQFVKSEVSHNLPIEEINKKAQVLQKYFHYYNSIYLVMQIKQESS